MLSAWGEVIQFFIVEPSISSIRQKYSDRILVQSQQGRNAVIEPLAMHDP